MAYKYLPVNEPRDFGRDLSENHEIFAKNRRFSSVRFVPVDYEVGISAASQLVQVHADALAVRVHAEGMHTVEQPEKQVDQRQNKAEQSGDAHQLSHQLTGLIGEDADSEQSPKASRGVNGNCAGGIVDGKGKLAEFD